jgi:mRNA interferase RelE/StbE
MYRLYLLRPAERELGGLPSALKARVERAIMRLAENPRPRSARKLQGDIGWRLRVGDYRVIYHIDDEAREVTVVGVRHRRDVYRI